MYELTDCPFSCFQSWMSISIPRKTTGEIFFRNCHNGPHNAFPFRLVVNGETVKPEITTSPWLLTLRHGDACVEICFESADSVRLRGTKASLQLGDGNLIYSEGSKRAVINVRKAFRRYQLEVLHGEIELQKLAPTHPFYASATVGAGADEDSWELAIDEFWSTWEAPERLPTFDHVKQARETAFRAFLDTMPAAREQDEDARMLATYIDWSCTVGPCGLIKRPTMFMSKNWMCNVWSWDQCFNGMAMAAGQPELAMDQMLTLVDHQDQFGSYPDAVNDMMIHYNYSKPPVHGWAFSEILKRVPKRLPDDVIRTMYDSLCKQANWWMTHRRREGEELPYYLHGNDSGWDNSTMFDGGVPLVAPDLSALLVLQMDVVADLADGMGQGDAAAEWRQRADSLYAALMSELWRDDHFIAQAGADDIEVECRSLIPWLPIILGTRLPEDIRDCLKTGIEGHLTEWGLATERVDSPKYDADGYWRGPIWAPSTYIAVTGLDRCGFVELADEVSDRFCRLCGTSGFAENYDATTGAPLRDKAYTWTASVFLLLAERMQKRRGEAALD